MREGRISGRMKRAGGPTGWQSAVTTSEISLGNGPRLTRVERRFQPDSSAGRRSSCNLEPSTGVLSAVKPNGGASEAKPESRPRNDEGKSLMKITKSTLAAALMV